MKDFNLQKYLKKNVLLKEGIGGYVDMKPATEEIGTAMGEEDSMTADRGWAYDDEFFDSHLEGLIDPKNLSNFKSAAQYIADDLEVNGVEMEDIKVYLISQLQNLFPKS